MEALFVSWMFTCFIGSGAVYIAIYFFGGGHEAAIKMFNHVIFSASIGGLVGAIFSGILFVVFLVLGNALSLDLDAWMDFIGTQGLTVIFFANISVMSAFIAITESPFGNKNK